MKVKSKPTTACTPTWGDSPGQNEVSTSRSLVLVSKVILPYPQAGEAERWVALRLIKKGTK